MKCAVCEIENNSEDINEVEKTFEYPSFGKNHKNYCYDCFQELRYKFHGLYDDEIFDVAYLKDEKSQLNKYKEILEKEESKILEKEESK